jgi:hypothetical protein
MEPQKGNKQKWTQSGRRPGVPGAWGQGFDGKNAKTLQIPEMWKFCMRKMASSHKRNNPCSNPKILTFLPKSL